MLELITGDWKPKIRNLYLRKIS